LLYEDESEALTHPYLASVWARIGMDLRVGEVLELIDAEEIGVVANAAVAPLGFDLGVLVEHPPVHVCPARVRVSAIVLGGERVEQFRPTFLVDEMAGVGEHVPLTSVVGVESIEA